MNTIFDVPLKLEERILTGIELGESHFREFKSALQRDGEGNESPRSIKEIGRHIGQELVAFANADGGELYVGVEDDGTISGIPHSQEKVAILENAPHSYVHPDTPLEQPVIKILEVNGKKILYFKVSKSNSVVHLTSEGRCLQRFDRVNKPVPAEKIQAQRSEIKSLEYDREFIPNATVQDLDLNLLSSISAEIVSGYSPEKLLQFFNVAEFGPEGIRLRRSALLLFAKDIVSWHPRCEVRFLRIRGTELGAGDEYNVEEDQTIRGNIVTILEDAWQAWRPYLARTKLQPSGLFRESIIYPEEACREALINAVAHRDYSIEGKPIEVFVYDDRMEVRSPGSLLSTITIDSLKRLDSSHQSRNVFTARVLRELGYMR